MDWLGLEETWLAPYAMHGRHSRGRQHPEDPHPFRTIYQRDRERLVHCTAFRRMVGKTQVLVGQINDHHRTRLTHTLEVAQISRTIARRLRLNEDLTEAIALSHDIGHPPFGHAGERALNACLKDHGGFDHNVYGLRRVDLLEDRYPGGAILSNTPNSSPQAPRFSKLKSSTPPTASRTTPTMRKMRSSSD
jgi:dGTPase